MVGAVATSSENTSRSIRLVYSACRFGWRRHAIGDLINYFESNTCRSGRRDFSTSGSPLKGYGATVDRNVAGQSGAKTVRKSSGQAAVWAVQRFQNCTEAIRTNARSKCVTTFFAIEKVEMLVHAQFILKRREEPDSMQADMLWSVDGYVAQNRSSLSLSVKTMIPGRHIAT